MPQKRRELHTQRKLRQHSALPITNLWSLPNVPWQRQGKQAHHVVLLQGRMVVLHGLGCQNLLHPFCLCQLLHPGC